MNCKLHVSLFEWFCVNATKRRARVFSFDVTSVFLRAQSMVNARARKAELHGRKVSVKPRRSASQVMLRAHSSRPRTLQKAAE
jgi:hypothetical protein